MSTSGALLRSALLVPLALLVLAAPAAPQIPGGDPGESLRQRQLTRMQYRAEILNEVNDVLSDWTDDWRDDEAASLADRYAESATIRGLPFGGANGRDAIESAMGDLLGRSGDVRLRLQDFEASGRLAFGLGHYEFSMADAREGSVTREGAVLMVFERLRGGWKIRSQLFRSEGEASGGSQG